MGGKTVALIIYIDDMIVTGNDEDEISELQKYIASEFEMKDRGGLKYFLGIEVYKSKLGIFLSQRKYVLDLLDRYVRLQTCRNTNHTKSLFSKYPDQVPTNKEWYQKVVGRLIYVPVTYTSWYRICNQPSHQFMHNLSEIHIEAALRVLRYLKSSPGRGILFSKNNHLNLIGYTDADWAENLTESLLQDTLSLLGETW